MNESVGSFKVVAIMSAIEAKVRQTYALVRLGSCSILVTLV